MVMVQLESPTEFSSDYLSNMDLSPPQQQQQQKPSTVCKHALLKKVKTNKHKFFVLYKDCTTAPARLEYYDSESQWRKKKKAKRTIYLRTCFSINAFSDTRVKFGMTIFTRDDSFQIGFESEQTRDMWLADIRLLSHSSAEQSHSAVNQVWSVRVHSRSIKHPFEGDFKLCLNENQASLESKDDVKQMFVLPLEVITRCAHQDKYCVLEVNHYAVTGPGKLWMALEDSLIAQHVCRAIEQNKSITSPEEDSFRPVSRSLSFKDRKAAFSARLRSGSDVRQRNRIGQSLSKLGQYSSVALPSSSSACFQRDRSDSIDSHSTTASQSTDESDSCQNWTSSSRSTTPDLRADCQSHHMSMIMRTGDKNCKCLSSNGSLSSDENGSRPQDKNSNFVYVDMSGSHSLPCPCLDTQQGRSSDYIDMTAGKCSPNTKVCKVKPESVKCYLIEDEGQYSEPKPANSPILRTPASPAPRTTDEYVDMCRRKMLTEKDKSSSAPHLLPVLPCQQHSSEQRTGNDVFMNIDFDNRHRAASLSYAHRPRGSSWSQFIRPRSSTTDHKRRVSRKCRTSNNNSADCLSSATDYIDMTCGLALPEQDSYVEMSLDKESKQRLALVNSNEREDKENYVPYQSSRIPPVSHPFPELLSASSEDDVSLHSMEGSVSLHSITSSADSMSTSSHSSHHSSALTTPLDAEPYVAMHPTPSNGYVKCNSHRLLLKPTRVSSYIVDDADNDKGKSTCGTGHADYMEMSPSTNSRTKQ